MGALHKIYAKMEVSKSLFFCNFHLPFENSSYLEYYLLQPHLDFIQYFSLLCRFPLLCLLERIILMKENDGECILSKMEMMLVGSRELANDMESGPGSLALFHGFPDFVTIWQVNTSFC